MEKREERDRTREGKGGWRSAPTGGGGGLTSLIHTTKS